MKVFIHIGYPKCFSTTLQRNFFPTHPDIYYGGIGINSNIDFINNDLNLLFESGLLYFNPYLFDREFDRFQYAVNDFKEKAKINGKKVAGFSSEHMIFNFSPQGIHYREKIDRIYRLFGEDVKLIMITREPGTLIKSLYAEYVRMGYFEDFNTFLDWIYKYQDRNFFYDLKYDEVINYLHRYYSSDNICICRFEDYKNESGVQLQKLFRKLSDFLEIEYFEKEIKNFNPSLEQNDIGKMLLSNKEIEYDFGGRHLNGIEDHRRRVYFNEFLGLEYSEDELFDNVIRKRRSLKEMMNKVSDPNDGKYDENKLAMILDYLKSN